MRRLKVPWPTPFTEAPADGRSIRLLAVSDEPEKALEYETNRQSILPLDAVLAAGDLEPDYLSFLGDAFRVPLLYVRGNHDRGGAWEHGGEHLPRSLDGTTESIAGVSVAGMSWPSDVGDGARRDELAAWWQAIGLYRRARIPGPVPRIVVSHVPPHGLGDTLSDPYHTGFAGYRWLCRQLRPVLWVHGHTTLAAAAAWRASWGPTTLVNVTGAALIELEPAARSQAPGERRAA